MEAVGINVGYLAIQLLCFGMFVVVFAGAVYLATRYAYNKAAKSDDSELLMTLDVMDEGIVIPKSIFEAAAQVELRRTKTQLILRPIDKESP